jgi:hypothetical protein
MLSEKCRATVFLRDSHPAAGLAGDLALGRLHGPPGARCLARRAIMLLELATSPPQRGPLPASTANTTRHNAGIVERLLSLLPTLRAAPSHAIDSTDREGLRPFRASPGWAECLPPGRHCLISQSVRAGGQPVLEMSHARQGWRRCARGGQLSGWPASARTGAQRRRRASGRRPVRVPRSEASP